MKGRLIQRKIMIFGPGCKNFLGPSHCGHQIFQISQKRRFKAQLKIGTKKNRKFQEKKHKTSQQKKPSHGNYLNLYQQY